MAKLDSYHLADGKRIEHRSARLVSGPPRRWLFEWSEPEEDIQLALAERLPGDLVGEFTYGPRGRRPSEAAIATVLQVDSTSWEIVVTGTGGGDTSYTFTIEAALDEDAPDA